VTAQPQVDRDQLVIPGLESVIGRSFPPALKFDAPGVTHTLTVADADTVQDTDYKTKQPLTWPSGDPKMLLVLIGADEDGQDASLWVRGRRMTEAFREARKAVGVRNVAVGDVVTVVRGEDEILKDAPKAKDVEYATTWEFNVVPAGVK
jgi:hypothetical protein